MFVQNFRPGVADRMGLGEDAVRAVAPKIVYVSISGFGETGPYAQKPVYDPLIQAVSGLATIQAGSDTERPRLVRTILPDKLTGVQRRPGDHRRAAVRASGPARASTSACRCWTRSSPSCGRSDMGSQTFVGAGHPAAGGRQLHRPDL